MEKQFNQPESREHYLENYDDLPRFISYFHQINLIKKLRVKTVLEVGVGNKTLSDCLKRRGFEVTTCDIDKKLNPDFVGDIRKLPFEENQFDCVVAFEVLEHIPFADFPQALSELRRISKDKVIISLPYSSVYFEFLLRFPFIDKMLKKNFLRLFLSLPLVSHKFLSKEHYWELGRKNYSLKKVRTLIKKYFRIIREIRPPIDTYHYFFVLEKIK